MKNTRYFLLALTVIVCFGVVFSASAADQLTAKQIMLNRLQSADFVPIGDINKTSTGTAYYQVKTLSGALASSFAPVAKMAGADLKMDYKLDSPENKMSLSYNVNYDNNKYNGSMFIDNGKLILTTDILSLLNKIQSGTIPEGKALLPYAYTSNQGMSSMWGNINKGQYIQPELKNLMVFFVEAVPDKYFSVSLKDQKISFNLDQAGFEDVTLAVLNKVANEKETFAALVADYFAAAGQQQAADVIKKDLLAGIEQSINDGSYPDTPDEVKKMMAGVIVLEELKYEASLIPQGQNSLNMIMNLGGGPEFSGQMVLKSDFTSSKELLSGTYTFDVSGNASEPKMSLDGQMKGVFNQTGTDSKSNETIRLNVKDSSSGSVMLDLLIEGYANARADQNVQVNIPVLTAENSIDLEKLMNNNPVSSNNTPVILLNGMPVAFDVNPYVVNLETGSRILVPLRNLAEALGCEVGWVNPDQINIMLGETTINMFINKTGYMMDGVEKQLDAPPFIMEDRTMVPLRFVAEELGCTVEYDSATNTVNIHTK
jgi:hypothetical protein